MKIGCSRQSQCNNKKLLFFGLQCITRRIAPTPSVCVRARAILRRKFRRSGQHAQSPTHEVSAEVTHIITQTSRRRCLFYNRRCLPPAGLRSAQTGFPDVCFRLERNGESSAALGIVTESGIDNFAE